jgi:3-mercaptopyruvate sulfurtransferase SseA
VALLLRKRGIERIRPLAGGLQAWLDRGFAVEPVRPRAATQAATAAPATDTARNASR